MTRFRLKELWFASCLVNLVVASAIRAEDSQPIKLTLHPMAAPTPALKYRLLPPADELVFGNAAVAYGKVTADEWHFFSRQSDNEKWLEMPLDKLRGEKISLPETSTFFLEQGAKCKYCDWQLPIGQVPFYKMPLPDAQQARSFSRLLTVKARFEIANGRFEDAIRTFQTTYALGRNISQGETLVHGLVGVAIATNVSEPITEYIQQPEAPNLYWALTALPSPLITLDKALDVEGQAMVLSFSELRDVETARRTAVEWSDIFHRIARQIVEATPNGLPPVPPPLSDKELDKLCEQRFPAIKRRLVADGMPAEKVDAMDIHQAALVYTLNVSRDLFDDVVKCHPLPYPEAVDGMNAAFERAETRRLAGEIVPLAKNMRGVLEAAPSATVRCDRRIVILRILEALRIFGASHNGSLPEKLSDIHEAAVPADPVTTQPFEYVREGNKARLHGPTLYGTPVNYEITMAPRK